MTITDLMASYTRYTTAADLSACRGVADAGAGRATTSILVTTTFFAGDAPSGSSLSYWSGADWDGASGDRA